ncbi:MAG: hypothetical protein Q8R44_02505, partial [Novosphingobium sp.]|nr:hypothetical protein [Novosphingobium sp.]
ILAENGGWAIFPTTPRGRNHAATMFEEYRADPGWFVEKLTAKETTVFSPETLERERLEYIRELGPKFGASVFEQEYLCSFDAASIGNFYAHLITQAEQDGRIGIVPFDPVHTVETWWDLGYSDATAIWFVQRAGQQFRVIDYYEASGAGIEHYAKVLRQLGDERGYDYSAHLWPHDGGHGSFDTGKTRVEVAKDLGFKARVMPKHDVDDGIQAVRAILPRCWFDAKKCERGISALRQYRAEWDDTLKALRQKPLHDWTSHAADAFRTGAKYAPPGWVDDGKALEMPDIGVV